MASLCAVGYVTLAQVVVEYSSLVGMLVVTAGAMVSWRTGFQPARLYLAGQTALFVAVLVTILHSWGVIDWPFIMENGLQSGVAIEVMVFALALSSRLRLMQATQAQLQRRADEAVRVSESDPLTGICNRAGLASKARDLLAMQRQRTLILIDLDKFKPINDIHGHAAGDAMLVEVARRLKEQLRTSDVVARVGGDEFVVLIVEPHDRAELEVICQRLLVAIGKPLLFHGTTLNVGSSMGLARYPKDGAELAGLLHAADVAMYHVKKNGRSGFAFLEDLSSKETLMAERGVAKTNATGCDVESQ
jgi:diguanylate cyclase (GGDEF)-like protein